MTEHRAFLRKVAEQVVGVFRTLDKKVLDFGDEREGLSSCVVGCIIEEWSFKGYGNRVWGKRRVRVCVYIVKLKVEKRN